MNVEQQVVWFGKIERRCSPLDFSSTFSFIQSKVIPISIPKLRPSYVYFIEYKSLEEYSSDRGFQPLQTTAKVFIQSAFIFEFSL